MAIYVENAYILAAHFDVRTRGLHFLLDMSVFVLNSRVRSLFTIQFIFAQYDLASDTND